MQCCQSSLLTGVDCDEAALLPPPGQWHKLLDAARTSFTPTDIHDTARFTSLAHPTPTKRHATIASRAWLGPAADRGRSVRWRSSTR